MKRRMGIAPRLQHGAAMGAVCGTMHQTAERANRVALNAQEKTDAKSSSSKRSSRNDNSSHPSRACRVRGHARHYSRRVGRHRHAVGTMSATFKWLKTQGRFSSGETCYLGAMKVGGYHWDGLSPRGSDAVYKPTCMFHSNLPNRITSEDARQTVERVVIAWLSKAGVL